MLLPFLSEPNIEMRKVARPFFASCLPFLTPMQLALEVYIRRTYHTYTMHDIAVDILKLPRMDNGISLNCLNDNFFLICDPLKKKTKQKHALRMSLIFLVVIGISLFQISTSTYSFTSEHFFFIFCVHSMCFEFYFQCCFAGARAKTGIRIALDR